jgi:hypothetical protein
MLVILLQVFTIVVAWGAPKPVAKPSLPRIRFDSIGHYCARMAQLIKTSDDECFSAELHKSERKLLAISNLQNANVRQQSAQTRPARVHEC